MNTVFLLNEGSNRNIFNHITFEIYMKLEPRWRKVNFNIGEVVDEKWHFTELWSGEDLMRNIHNPIPQNRIGGAIVNMLSSSAVDRKLELTKYYEIGICCISAKHATLRSKSKDCLDWDNML